ncbi:uncharacterized protein LOC143916133 [Arctopsyche grandis]|uniref:uncharacterized protein LOC143916133 n=1 Tax=Arctopsyche grandis TaxID=121162 RepID=UPI00406D761B
MSDGEADNGAAEAGGENNVQNNMEENAENSDRNQSTVNLDFLGAPVPPFPPFWAENPQIWFAQMEASFEAARITSENTRYCRTIACLPREVMTEIWDIHVAPPKLKRYTFLKKEILERLGVGQRQRHRRLLEREEIGDRKPSQFLRDLRILAAQEMSEDLLRTTWESRLPEGLSLQLAMSDETDLDKLARKADRWYDSSPHVAAMTDRREKRRQTDDEYVTRGEFQTLNQKVDDLTTMMGRLLQTNETNRKESRPSHSPARSRRWQPRQQSPRGRRNTPPRRFNQAENFQGRR